MFGCALERDSSNLCNIADPASAPLRVLSMALKVSCKDGSRNASDGTVIEGLLTVKDREDGRDLNRGDLAGPAEGSSQANSAIHFSTDVWCFLGMVHDVAEVTVDVTDGVDGFSVAGTL